jgi:hypothetical protein
LGKKLENCEECKIQAPCQTTKSSFTHRDENVVAAPINGLSVTRPAKETVLISSGSFQLVHVGGLEAQADGIIQASLSFSKDPVHYYSV